MPRLRAITLLSLATSLFVPAAFAQNTNNARPGTINYVEGQVTIDGQMLTSQSVGTAEVATGQTVATLNGKAEVLLTPGVFLRLGDNSAVTMVTPDLTKTEVQLDRGVAEVEVDQLYKQNDILIDQGPAQAVLLKDGLYEFDATANQVRVFDGLASVSPAQNAKKWITLKDHHSLAITGEAVKPADFNDQLAANQDPLYSWSKLRADYLGQANLNLAETYAGSPYNPGWMWDQGMMDYTWLPYDGMFMDPFGFGFYSPWYLYGGGFIYPGYGFGGGYYGGYGNRGGYGVHGPYRGGTATAPGRGFSGGGLRGGVAAAPGRGFSGGGGGFSGGGGFHGGGGGGRR
jgi:hypothetical protein